MNPWRGQPKSNPTHRAITFMYLKVREMKAEKVHHLEKDRDQDRDRDCFYPLVHSSKSPYQAVSGSGRSHKLNRGHSKGGHSQRLEQSLLSSKVPISRKLKLKADLDSNSRLCIHLESNLVDEDPPLSLPHSLSSKNRYF